MSLQTEKCKLCLTLLFLSIVEYKKQNFQGNSLAYICIYATSQLSSQEMYIYWIWLNYIYVFTHFS